MIPIYNQHGHLIAWLQGAQWQRQVVHDLYGQARAYLHHNELYTFDGRHLGRFSRGYFRDHLGSAVAFVEDATNGPVSPLPGLLPFPPLPGVTPIPALPPLPPLPAVELYSWSYVGWDEFVSG